MTDNTQNENSDVLIFIPKNEQDAAKIKSLASKINATMQEIEQTEEHRRLMSLKEEFKQFLYHPIHTMALRKRSKVLNDAFKKTNNLLLYETSDDELTQVLEYMYSGKYSLSVENAVGLLYWSRKFDVPDLINKVENHLKQVWSTSTVITLFKKSLKYEKLMFGTDDFKKKCYDYIVKEFVEIAKTPRQFTQLPFEILVNIITSSDLNIESDEYAVYKVVMEYIKHVDTLQKDQKVQLLNLIPAVPMHDSIKMLVLAKDYGAEKLKSVVLARNIDETMDLSFLSKEEFINLMHQPNLNVRSEFALYTIIKEHVPLIQGFTEEDILQLKKLIQLEWMSESELEEIISNGFIPPQFVTDTIFNVCCGKVDRAPKISYCKKVSVPITGSEIDSNNCRVLVMKDKVARYVPAKICTVVSTSEREFVVHTNNTKTAWTNYDGVPFTTDKAANRYQCLYRQSDVIKTNVCIITALKIHITTAPAKNLENFTIKIGTTDDSHLTKWVKKTDTYLGPKTVIPSETMAVMKLNKPFVWDQKSNIVFEFIWTVTAPSASGSAHHVLLPGTVLKATGTSIAQLDSVEPVKSSECILITLVGKSKSLGAEIFVPKGFTPKIITDGKTNIPVE